jgi:hypothetical protein
MCDQWLSAMCGRKKSMSIIQDFVSDMTSVMNRIVHTLARSASRQHRSLKHCLAELNILQHRAWDIGSGNADMKGLWSFVILIACTLIQLNLALNFELNLVPDLTTPEPDIIYYLLETTSNVKLYILNEQISFMKSCKNFSLDVATEIRNQTMVTAIEHSAMRAASALLASNVLGHPPKASLGHIFQLRSIPLRSFLLPKTVSLGEFMVSSSTPDSVAISAIDECIMWIDKAMKLFHTDRINGPLIGGDLIGMKKALLTSKMAKLKRVETQSGIIRLIHHPFIVSLSLS